MIACQAVVDTETPCSLYIADADIISMDAFVEEPRGVVVGVTFVVKVSEVFLITLGKYCFETFRSYIYFSFGNFLFQKKSRFYF